MLATKPLKLRLESSQKDMAPIQGSVAQSGERHSVTVEEAGSKPVGTAMFCSHSLMAKLRPYTPAMALDEGMIQVRVLVGVPIITVWYNGITSVSKTDDGGSIPSTVAKL